MEMLVLLFGVFWLMALLGCVYFFSRADSGSLGLNSNIEPKFRFNLIKTGVKAEEKIFTFLIHPLTAEDLGRRGAGMIRNLLKKVFGKKLGGRLANKLNINEQWGMKHLPNEFFEKLLPYLPGRLGFTVCSKFSVHNKATGFIVATLLTSKQFKKLPRAKVQERVLKNILFCQKKLRAKRIGLGAYNAPALLLKSGISIFKATETELTAEKTSPRVIKLLRKVTCGITDGDSLSSIIAIPAIEQGLKIRNKKALEEGLGELSLDNAIVSIVGATGVVGDGLAKSIIAHNPKELRLITHTREIKLQQLKNKLVELGYTNKIVTSLKTEVIKGSDVVITCTTGIGEIVKPRFINKDQFVVIVDMARPINVLPTLLQLRPRVTHIDGGIFDIGDVDTRFDMGAGTKRSETFACLVQTILETCLGVKEHKVGDVCPNYARHLLEKCESFGFCAATPKSFRQEYQSN